MRLQEQSRCLVADTESPVLFILQRSGIKKAINISDNDKVMPLSNPCSQREITRGWMWRPILCSAKTWAACETRWSVKLYSPQEWSIHSHLTIFFPKLKDITIHCADTEEVESEGSEQWAIEVVNSIISLTEHTFYSSQPTNSSGKRSQMCQTQSQLHFTPSSSNVIFIQIYP